MNKTSKNYKKNKYKKKNIISNLNLDEESIKLNNIWVLWSHDLHNNNWDIDSFNKIYEFNTINDFWRLYNNFNILGGLNKKNFFLMKKDIKPIWEDDKNKNGGTCSMKIPITKSLDMWTDLSMYIIGETFIDCKIKMDDINGISICSKNIWSIIKIWNSNSDNDTSKELPDDFLKKFNKCSIKFKKNVPEY
jgi:hypothetical protein